MAPIEIIGRGLRHFDKLDHYPCEVGVVLDDAQHPILLSEGFAHGGTGGGYSLQQMREEAWQMHLHVCGCDWLVALAEEEGKSGRRFTPSEILGRAKQHGTPLAGPLHYD